MASPGRLIVFEGLDGSGKTTQAKLLVDRLTQRGIPAQLTAEPSRGPLGRLIRDWLSADEQPSPTALALLFAADRRIHLAETVEPALARGEWVISDRYLLSSLAYQTIAGDLDPGWILTLNRGVRPADLTIYLDLPVNDCLSRLAARSGPASSFERRTELSAIEARYASAIAELIGAGWTIQRVLATGSVEAVAEEVWQVVGE